MPTMPTVPTTRRDDGAALVLVIIWSAVLLVVAAALSTAVMGQVRPSDKAEKSFQAWSAAEAGVEDLRSRLAANGTYWKSVDAYNANPGANTAVATANPALAGWVNVPGGASDAQFTYYLDTSNASRTGRMIISATGRAGTGAEQATRTIEAEVQKRTTNEYAYLSNSETYPYDEPGVYSPVGSNPTGSEKMTADVAEKLCGTGGALGTYYWYQWTNSTSPLASQGNNPVATTSKKVATITNWGVHKNSVACLHGQVNTTDRWIGPIHTNDVWYLDPNIPNIDPNTLSGLSTQVFTGAVTSSCVSEAPGAVANSACRENHRWISTATLPGESNLGTDPRYSAYITNEIPNTASENGKLWNPAYDSPVEMPSDAMIAAVKVIAKTQGGCIFSGPTRIRMQTVAGSAKLVITSPDTVDTAVTSSSFCGGTSLYSANGISQPTITLDYATMVAAGFNGLIYVEDSALGANAPSCKAKTSPAIAAQSSYPWVIPTAASETITLTQGTPLGFPSATTKWTGNLGPSGVYDEWTDNPAQQCYKGHVFLQANAANGGYTGQYTIAADADVVITDDIVEASVVTLNRLDPTQSTWGVPDSSSTNQLGVVPKRWLYVYHLQQSKGGNNNGVSQQLRDLILNFSILAPNKCLSVQDYNSVPQMNDMKVVGSIGQNNRCRITDPSAGYDTLTIEYDQRLPLLGPPPYLAELSQEPWKVKVWSETNVRRDVPAKVGVSAQTGSQGKSTTKSYNVLAGAPAGSTLLYARILSGVGTVKVANNQVQYISPSGVSRTVVEFVISKADGTRVGQTLTISVA